METGTTWESPALLMESPGLEKLGRQVSGKKRGFKSCR